MADPLPKTRLLTLAFTDLVGSTALKKEMGDRAAGDLIARHRDHVHRLLGEADGREVKSLGDGFFLTFETISAAVVFGLRLQQIHASESDLPAVRIGIHLGDVTELPASADSSESMDIEGLAADVASRIQSLALPGQVLMSSVVFNSARQRLSAKEFGTEVAWRAHGPYLFKGIDEPIEIGEAGIEGISPLEAPPDSEKARSATRLGDEITLNWRPANGIELPSRPNWVLEKSLGEGGFAEIWLARHKKSKERRVFKFCFEADRLRGLKREVTVFRLIKETLGNRDDICKLLDWNFDEAPFYIESEYTEANDLMDWAREQGGLDQVPLETRLELIAQAATALAAAHSVGVIHKDVKAANILISKDLEGRPRAVLTDFGIGLITDKQLLELKGITVAGLTEVGAEPGTSSTSGTRLCMAPEMLEGKPATAASDMYALGILLYQMVSGDLNRALGAGWERDVEDELLREDIALCVDRLPERRIQDAGELAHRLRSLEKRHAEREAEHKAKKEAERHRKRRKVALISVPAVLVFLGLCVVGVWFFNRAAKLRWARQVAIPEIKRLIDQDDYYTAFTLAREAEKYISNDPTLTELRPRISRDCSITTTPPGAEVVFKEYSAVDGDWVYLGRSPLENIRFPFGVYRWQIKKEGFETRECVAGGYLDSHSTLDKTHHIDLQKEGGSLPSMVAIPAASHQVNLLLLRHLQAVEAPAYLIDKYEVTNEQFREFVDKGGYEDRDYWKHEFIKDGQVVSWERAMAEFRDKTGRPGPSTWEGETYPKGQENYPVCGVSWHEAAAYAEFKGKSLPTVYHWSGAARPREASVIVPFSNLESEGLAPVGSYPGVGLYGLYDMAGNVKEWCQNATDDSGDRRYILGGAWSEPTYMFTSADTRPPWDRSASNGFRCVQYGSDEESVSEALFRPIEPRAFRDYSSETPVSDEVFQLYKNELYAYNRTDLNTVVEPADESSEHWRKEKITFDAAYGNERMIGHLFLPNRVKPPYQTVIFFPGSDALRKRSFNLFDSSGRTHAKCVIMSGRALMYPIYKGTYEREIVGGSPYSTNMYRDWIIQLSKDLQRSMDYLETRDDIDGNKIAYYGVSLGARLGPIMLATEDRIKLGIFVVGGFRGWELPPAVDEFNFTPRVKVPVLMINGKEDHYFPFETCQKPMFELLGTPDEDKDHIVYPGGHGLWGLFSRGLLSRQIKADVLGWLDHYFGPVG